ncbi:MAG: hypothetical protein JNK02_00960 [Planctomycetes bacterium]|nr:hypothetical protein [Planctomycetota bacterium]
MKTRALARLLLALPLAAGCAARDPGPVADAPSRGVPSGTRAEYRVRLLDPARRAVEVELRLEGLDPATREVELSLPEGYSFVRLDAPLFAAPLVARTAAGAPLAVANATPYRWTLATQGADSAIVSWTAALTAHERPEVAERDAYGHPYVAPDHAILMTGALLVAPSLPSEPTWRVRVAGPAGWPVLAPWPEVEPGVLDPGSRNALHNDLLALGAWSTRCFQLDGMRITAAFAPGQPALEALAAPAIERICAAELELFGMVPRSEYLFLFVAPRPVAGFSFAGSPKTGAMVLQVCGDLANPVASERVSHLVAHEFHHLWAVARLDFGDDLRFVGEGFTDWYAHLVPARLGLWSWERFGEELGAKLDAWLRIAPDLDASLREAGGRRFFEGGAHYEATYSGGLLVAALLDLELRRAGRAEGLDGFLRSFVNDPRWSRAQGPGWADFLDHVELALGPDARERVGAWTGDPRRFFPALELKRLGVAVERVEEPRRLRANFDGARITALDPRSEAGALGLATGDLVRAVNGREVADARAIQAAWAEPVAGEVEVRIERGGSELVLRAPVRPAPSRSVVDASAWSDAP